MEIIPAIDIIDGKCVRLTQGDYNQKKIYNENPLEVARQFENHGINRLHVVDLDGAKAKRIVNWKTLETICNQTKLTVDFGGGLKSYDDLRIAFNSGASQVTGGSIAVKDRTTFVSWINQYSPERIILGADVKNENIAISGWQDETKINLFEFIEGYVKEGIQYVICTDIAKDGMMEGPSFNLYSRLKEKFPDIQIIASGGVSTLRDIERLKAKKLYGAIIGKAIYEGTIKLKELSKLIMA